MIFMNKMLSAMIIILNMLLICCGIPYDKTPDSDDSDSNNNGGYNENYRNEMRSLVEDISIYAKGINSNFIVIPQNGIELLTVNGEEDGPPATDYINAIDGVGQEDLFYGYDNDNVATPAGETNYMTAFLDTAEDNGVEVLVTDYCSTLSNVDDSYTKNFNKGYISFAADHRELDNVPGYPVNPYNVNTDDITSLPDAENFLYLINPDSFSNKTDYLNALKNTNHDILIIDLYFDGNALLPSDLSDLKKKLNSADRLVIAYMSIGEAEDYRYYWQSSWDTNPPVWLDEENPDWPGNYKVKYWYTDWQDIIFGNDASYLKKIIDAGFDGVYLDIIDAFEYYE